MKYRIKSAENFWSGLLFFGFGMLAIVLSRDYPMGSSLNMGPGYFPTVVGSILCLLGMIIFATAFKLEGQGVESFAWRPMIFLSAGFAFFGWAMNRVGFILALLMLIIVCAAAGREFKWKEVLIMSAALVAGSWVIFLWILELPFPLFWWN